MEPVPAPPPFRAGTGASDLSLVRRALGGEASAVEELLTRLSCVLRFVYRLNRSLGYHLAADVLEDVVQQVYAAIWPRLGDFAGQAALESWAFGFCRNCLRSEARKTAARRRLHPQSFDALGCDVGAPGRGVGASTGAAAGGGGAGGERTRTMGRRGANVGDGPLPVASDTAEAAVFRREGLDALREELERLNPVEREAVELRHLEGWSFEEIARRQGLPASTVKDRCYRAMSKMKERLQRRHVIV